MPSFPRRSHGLSCLVASVCLVAPSRADPVTPLVPVRFFDGTSLNGVTPWIEGIGASDPGGIFTVADGLLHCSGEGFGVLESEDDFRDYQLVLEFRWGETTFGRREGKARDSGLVMHSHGNSGSWRGWLRPGIEAQIMEGGTGDWVFLEDTLPISMQVPHEQVACGSNTAWNCRGGYRYLPGGALLTMDDDLDSVHLLGWDPDWEDVKGFRGVNELESPTGDWNQMVVIADGTELHCYLNGTLVNEASAVSPSAGIVQLQTEGAEYEVRRWELLPLGAAVGPAFVRDDLPAAQIGQAVDFPVPVVGGAAPFQWEVSAGDLPPGVALGASDGRLSGTPLAGGAIGFELRVTDAGGGVATQDFVWQVDGTLGGEPPVVEVTSPALGASITSGEEVVLVATATDPEDGDLAAAVEWTSDLDGALGTGGSIAVATLSPGLHRITAAVTDPDFNHASDRTIVVVSSAAVQVVTSPVAVVADGLISGMYLWRSGEGIIPAEDLLSGDGESLRIAGDEGGHLYSHERYRDYRCVLEYRWGDNTPLRAGKVRNAGLLFHSRGDEAGVEDYSMPGMEVQMAEGSTGDFILEMGNDALGNLLPMEITVLTEQVECVHDTWNCRGGYRWNPAGTPVFFNQKEDSVHWFDWDPAWQDVTGFRGANDIERPLGEWNQLVVDADGDELRVWLNGTLVNEGFAVLPDQGRFQIEIEGTEYFLRRCELLPLGTPVEPRVDGALPAASLGIPYQAGLETTAGVGPFDWQVSSGALPAGLGLNAATGTISGVPQVAGREDFELMVTGSDGGQSLVPASLEITSETIPLDGLVLWLEADAGVSGAGANVAGWMDQSGQGNDLTAVGDPQWLAQGSPGGYPAVELDGDDGLVREGSISGFPAGSADRTMFAVIRYDASDDSCGVAYGYPAVNQAFGVIQRPTGGLLGLRGWGGGHDRDSTTVGIGAGWLVQSVILGDDTATHFKDGVEIDQWDHAYDTRVERIVVGTKINDSGNFTGGVAAVLVYDRALDPAEHATVVGQLTARYLELSALDSWRLAHFGSVLNEGPGASSANLDGDWMTTLMEFALNGDPMVTDSAGRFTRVPPELVGDAFVIRFPVRDGAVFNGGVATLDGVRYRLVASTTLDFTVPDRMVEEVPLPAGAEGPAIDPGWSYRAFRVVGEQPERVFLRLEVSDPGG